MLLPKQAPPVERKTSIATKTPAKAVKPQMTCGAAAANCGALSGESYYNTGQKC